MKGLIILLDISSSFFLSTLSLFYPTYAPSSYPQPLQTTISKYINLAIELFPAIS